MARWRHRRPVNDKIALAGVVYHLDECGSFVEDIPEDAARVLRKFPDLYAEIKPVTEEESDPIVLESEPDPIVPEEEEESDPLLHLSAEELKQRLKDAGQKVLGNPSAKTLRDRVRAL